MSLQGRRIATRINAGYAPSNYTPSPAGNESIDKLSAHLKGIDTRLSQVTSSGVFLNVTSDFAFSNVAAIDRTIALPQASMTVLRGRLYVVSDPNIFSNDLTFSIYDQTTRRGENVYFRLIDRLVYTELASAYSIGSTVLTLDDNSNLVKHDLVYLNGAPPSFGRVLSVSNAGTAQITLEEGTQYAYTTNNGVSRVIEFGEFTTFNTTAAKSMFVRLSFATAQTVTVRLTLDTLIA